MLPRQTACSSGWKYCNIENWSGFDESRKQTGGRGGFPFRLKWGHPTEIFIPQPGFLYLMHPGKGAQKHTQGPET